MLLKSGCLAIDGDGPHQCLASVLAEYHFGLCLSLGVLLDILFQKFAREYFLGRLSVYLALFEVVAIGAMEVGERACRFDHHIEWPYKGSIHGHYAWLRRNRLKSAKSVVMGMLCFSLFMKAARRSGILTSLPVAFSTVSLNLAGWAVSQNTPVSPSSSPEIRAW